MTRVIALLAIVAGLCLNPSSAVKAQSENDRTRRLISTYENHYDQYQIKHILADSSLSLARSELTAAKKNRDAALNDALRRFGEGESPRDAFAEWVRKSSLTEDAEKTVANASKKTAVMEERMDHFHQLWKREYKRFYGEWPDEQNTARLPEAVEVVPYLGVVKSSEVRKSSPTVRVPYPVEFRKKWRCTLGNYHNHPSECTVRKKGGQWIYVPN